MKPESTDLNHYLKPTAIIDWNTPGIRERAASITANLGDELADEVDKARRLFEWVRDAIPHAADIDSDLNPCRNRFIGSTNGDKRDYDLRLR